MTRVKICCITTIDEARLAVGQGASAVGLVSEMPSGPGIIPESRIREIAATVDPPVSTVLLTSLTKPEDIIAQHSRCRTSTIQMVDRLASGALTEIRRKLPDVSLVQVVHVSGQESLVEAREAVEQGTDAILLDSGDQKLPVKELGGTGRTHDWSVSARIVEQSPVPVFLAGGLNPSNVEEAIRSVRPFAVDVCSGVRTDDSLDKEKLILFMKAVTAAG